MRADLQAAVAELRRNGQIVTAPPASPLVLRPESGECLKPNQIELLQLYHSGLTGVALAKRLGVPYRAAQQRLKRMASHLGVPKVRGLREWADRNRLEDAA